MGHNRPRQIISMWQHRHEDGLYSNKCFAWILYCSWSTLGNHPLSEADFSVYCCILYNEKCLAVPKISVSLHGVLVSIFNVCPQDLKAVCIHPAHICLSCCLQDGLLYCLNSCVSGNAANLCHHADFLLSKDTTAGVHCLKMNTGILCLTQCALLCFFHPLSVKQKTFKEHFCDIIRNGGKWKEPFFSSC